MTEKTLKHELYKHGSYLISLKESGSAFVNIDDEIKTLEELYKLASKKDQPTAFTSEEAMWEYKYNELKALYEQMCQANEDLIQKNNKLKVDHQPTFEVGEYYSSDNGKKVFKILGNIDDQIEYCVYYVPYGTLKKWYIPEKDMLAIFPDSIPATAEQIATFKRAEHFAAHGRKLDEFRVGDKVNCSEIPFDNGYYTGDVVIQGFGKKTFVAGLEKGLHLYNLDDLKKVTLIQTAEELKKGVD